VRNVFKRSRLFLRALDCPYSFHHFGRHPARNRLQARTEAPFVHCRALKIGQILVSAHILKPQPYRFGDLAKRFMGRFNKSAWLYSALSGSDGNDDPRPGTAYFKAHLVDSLPRRVGDFKITKEGILWAPDLWSRAFAPFLVLLAQLFPTASRIQRSVHPLKLDLC
jgi:hypothetical protein